MNGVIKALGSLIRWHRIDSNSADNTEISGSLAGRIPKTLIYGKEEKSGADLGIGEIKRALIDFAEQAKMERIGKETL